MAGKKEKPAGGLNAEPAAKNAGKKYQVNWEIKGAGKVEPGKVYPRAAFELQDAQFAALLENGTISEV